MENVNEIIKVVVLSVGSNLTSIERVKLYNHILTRWNDKAFALTTAQKHRWRRGRHGTDPGLWKDAAALFVGQAKPWVHPMDHHR